MDVDAQLDLHRPQLVRPAPVAARGRACHRPRSFSNSAVPSKNT